MVLIIDWCKGPTGDLYVYLNMKQIPGIERDGINIYSIISVSYVDAILEIVNKVSKDLHLLCINYAVIKIEEYVFCEKKNMVLV